MSTLRERVVRRFVADSIGDIEALLQEYSKRFKEFTEFMPEATELQKKYKVVLSLSEAPDTSSREAYEAWSEKIKALRGDIPNRAYVQASTLIKYKGFAYLSAPAEKLCLAAVQQLVLPPKLRKSLEAAAKFWMKSTKRFKPKSPYNFPEKYAAEVIDIYIEDSVLYLKYLKLFLEVVKTGKPHTTEGLSATSIKAGPFTVVNTGGFDAIRMSDKVNLVEDCYHRLAKIGLGKVCYGNVLITNRIHGNQAVQAFYHIQSDELFVRGDAKVTMDGIQAVCHELTHRYQHKFMPDQKKRLSELYNKILYGGGAPKFPKDKYPKQGDSIVIKGETLIVDAVDPYENKVRMHIVDEPTSRFSIALEGYADIKGIEMEVPESGLYFVTPYAKSGGAGENFCEMVAYWCMGKLSEPMIELVKTVL